MIIDCQGQYIRLDNFRFTGTCRSCYKSMGTMGFFMQIKIDIIFLGSYPKRNSQGLCCMIFLPSFCNIQLLRMLHLIHFKNVMLSGICALIPCICSSVLKFLAIHSRFIPLVSYNSKERFFSSFSSIRSVA